MASFIIRNLPDEIHRALKVRAASNGRSLEAEVRAILESRIQNLGAAGLGTQLAHIGKKLQGLEFRIPTGDSPKSNNKKGELA